MEKFKQFINQIEERRGGGSKKSWTLGHQFHKKVEIAPFLDFFQTNKQIASRDEALIAMT